jgi:exonuclease SbcD
VKLLFYTDLHAADQNIRSRTGSYKDDILTKLREIIALANEHNVDYLINGADTFDRKSPWRVSHRLVREMIEIMSGFPGSRHLTVIGTHDVPTGQLEKLPQQPLGILHEAGAITVLNPDDLVGGCIRYPAIDNAGKDELYREYVVIHPVPARYDLDKDPENYAFHSSVDKISTAVDTNPFLISNRPVDFNPDDPVVTIAHGMVVKPGQSFFGDYTPADKISECTDADIFLYGHPHTPDGVYRTDGQLADPQGPTFIGPGSISRRDSSPYNRSRTPEVALITLPTTIGAPPQVQLVPLQSARPPQEVFADTIKDEEDENTLTERVNAFAHTLASTDISKDAWGSIDLIDEIRASSAEPRARLMAEEIVSELS